MLKSPDVYQGVLRRDVLNYLSKPHVISIAIAVYHDQKRLLNGDAFKALSEGQYVSCKAELNRVSEPLRLRAYAEEKRRVDEKQYQARLLEAQRQNEIGVFT